MGLKTLPRRLFSMKSLSWSTQKTKWKHGALQSSKQDVFSKAISTIWRQYDQICYIRLLQEKLFMDMWQHPEHQHPPLCRVLASQPAGATGLPPPWGRYRQPTRSGPKVKVVTPADPRHWCADAWRNIYEGLLNPAGATGPFNTSNWSGQLEENRLAGTAEDIQHADSVIFFSDRVPWSKIKELLNPISCHSKDTRKKQALQLCLENLHSARWVCHQGLTCTHAHTHTGS